MSCKGLQLKLIDKKQQITMEFRGIVKKKENPRVSLKFDKDNTQRALVTKPPKMS